METMPRQLCVPLPDLSRLHLCDSADVDALSKRKAHSGHHGVANDSSVAVRLVALSRLMRVRDEEMLEAAARSPVGMAVLDALRAVVLRVVWAVACRAA